MPELPDIQAYLAALEPRIGGQLLERIRILSPFLLRTADPPIDAAAGRTVVGLRRLGKRIVLQLGDSPVPAGPLAGAQSASALPTTAAAPPASAPLYLVLHLMIAGRLRWLKPAARPPGRITLALLDVASGTLAVTEAAQQKRASLHLVHGDAALRALDPGGLEVLDTDLAVFAAALRRENHTLKRSLTDPRLFSGIGNAYSDEILHAARLSPLALTHKLADDDVARLFTATQQLLRDWTARLTREYVRKFPGPGDVTAFRPEFAVHGRYDQPCPVCGTKVQRIRYADNETNYCPTCQTGGRLLADRSLSRLLREDWPRTIDDLP